MPPPELRRVRYLEDPLGLAEGWVCAKRTFPGWEGIKICDYENEGAMYDEHFQRAACKQCGHVWSNNLSDTPGPSVINYWFYKTQHTGAAIPGVPK